MIPASPDLLAIGGLTLDRFPDGTTAAGGSVLHIARAAARHGARLAVTTTAGVEPDARAAIEELRSLVGSLAVSPSPTTATFVHEDAAQGRLLRVLTRGGPIVLAAQGRMLPPRAVLLAPVLDELLDLDFGLMAGPWTRGAILQGWLRSVDADGKVRPLAVSAVPPEALVALAEFDVLVASREDLAADGAHPPDQLDAVRTAIGEGPVLVLTDGAAGAWLDVAGAARGHLPVPRVIDRVATVGAGDVLAALMLLGPDWSRPATSDFVRSQLARAMEAVAHLLAERRPSGSGDAALEGGPPPLGG